MAERAVGNYVKKILPCVFSGALIDMFVGFWVESLWKGENIWKEVPLFELFGLWIMFFISLILKLE